MPSTSVYNRITGENISFELTESIAIFGKISHPEDISVANSKPQFIQLKGRRVSNVEIVLQKYNNEWVVEKKSVNEVKLNEDILEIGKKYRVLSGDTLTVFEYDISIRADENQEQEIEVEERELVSQLESLIHNDLLSDDQIGAVFRQGGSEKVNYKAIIKLITKIAKSHVADLNSAQRTALINEIIVKIILSDIFADETTKEKVWKTIVDDLYITIGDSRKKVIADIIQSFSLDEKEHVEAERTLIKESHRLYNIVATQLTPAVIMDLCSNYLSKTACDLVFGFGPLEELLASDNVSEIMVVSKDQIFIEKSGKIQRLANKFPSEEVLVTVIERIVAPVGRRVDQSNPIVDARLPDGSRVNAVIKPIALKGANITIRKFKANPLTIEDLVSFGALSKQLAIFLANVVKVKKNIVVSGGTGSGKTTLLNILSSFIPESDRVITIEDTAELRLMQEHVVSLESRPSNIEGKGAITIRDLVKNALRMRPDRIVVGECRGGEALDMLQAMNTGHDGSLTTAHANTAEDMMRRFETMVLMAGDLPLRAIREQIASAVDIVVQLNRQDDGRRIVTEVAEIVGLDRQTGEIIVEPIFVVDEKAISAQFTGYVPTFIEKIMSMPGIEFGDIGM